MESKHIIAVLILLVCTGAVFRLREYKAELEEKTIQIKELEREKLRLTQSLRKKVITETVQYPNGIKRTVSCSVIKKDTTLNREKEKTTKIHSKQVKIRSPTKLNLLTLGKTPGNQVLVGYHRKLLGPFTLGIEVTGNEKDLTYFGVVGFSW